MNTRSSHVCAFSLSLMLLTAASATSVSAQTKPTPAKTAKPVQNAAVKPAKATKPASPIVLGTTQLPGDFGKLGTTYTIGTRDPINFTLKSMEYTTKPFLVGDNLYVPENGQKLLLLRYTVHNPQSREQSYYWASIRFTAVDAKDQNCEYITAVVRDGETQPLSVHLKPAQKIDVVAAIRVPGEGIVPKLIVERQRGEPVIRYDLHHKVAVLPAPFADPADPSGATALKDVPVPADATITIGCFDAHLDQVAYLDGPLGKREAGKDKRFLTATFTLKNRTNRVERYYWGDFFAEMRDAEDEKAPFTQALLKATRDEITSGDLAPGESVRVRFCFPLPKDVAGKTVRLLETKHHTASRTRGYVFDVSGAAIAAPIATATP